MDEHEIEDHFFNRGNEGIVVATAKALNESGIACVLWGRSCMRRWGHEYSKVLNVAFVVADDKVDQAMQCLLEKQPYTRQKVCVCDSPRDCDGWDQVCLDLPSKNHLHWEEGKWAKYHEARLEIFGRSELLRMIPMDALPSDYPDTASFAEAIKPDFCLISDSDLLPPRDEILGLGVGRPGKHPVVMPMPHLIVEVGLRLGARYMNTKWASNLNRDRVILGEDRRVVDASKIRHPVLRKVFVNWKNDNPKSTAISPHWLTAYFKEAPHIQVWFPFPNKKTE